MDHRIGRMSRKDGIYQVDITGQSGIIQVGNIPGSVPTDTRLRIKVGNEISSTFIVSDKV